ncbi:MAG: ubiquinone/menaquinone biosynthesis methyltransferase [Deltaproteobacteria bacterium]|nr:ubiquinone/menaquinone biosynthesis methyltransferase [Deltaproteobacteria bacterium]
MGTDIQQLFTQIAPTYDKLNRWLSFSRDRQWRAKAIAAATAKLEMRVVDLCAGTLDLTVACLKRFPHARITAIDFSQRMLDLGLKKVPHVFHAQTDLRCGDALATGLPDRSADCVMCAFGMRNLADQHRALAEIRRLLAPEGEFVMLEFFPPETRLARLFAKTYGRFVIPALGGLIAKNRAAYEHLRDSTASFYPLSAYRALLAQHGFIVTRAEYLSGGICGLIVARKSDDNFF